jgi:hypothetical protein
MSWVFCLFLAMAFPGRVSSFYSTVQKATKMDTKAKGYEGWKQL